MLKYETAYFCGYAKLPSALATIAVNGMLTLGLKIHLGTGKIEGVSVTLLSELAVDMVSSYFIGKHLIDDYDSMVEEVLFRHQGVASKSLIKALGDIRRNYIEYMTKNGAYLRGEESKLTNV